MVTPLDWALRLPAPVLIALERLEQAGFEVWLVGGCVRDLAIGRTPLDFDLSSNALPDQVLSVFPHAFATGLAHGTVTVLVEHHALEITTYRSESDYSDGRRPDKVLFETDIQKDLSRRDFTINSMAYHPRRGLLDPFGGWSDLMENRLRTVGDPGTRLREDALRMLRAVRFTLTYDLSPDPDLVRAIHKEKERALILSVERITHELGRMMNAAHGHALLAFEPSGLLPVMAQRLFGFQPDNLALVQLLAAWIRPAWHADQTVPLFYLACQFSRTERVTGLGLVPVPGFAAWTARLRSILSPRSLQDLREIFQQTCRMSRPASRHGHAMLYAAGLRLHLDWDRELDAFTLAVIIRVLAKTLALDSRTARQCAVDGWSLLAFIQPGLKSLGPELVNLRQQIQLEEETGPGSGLPVSLSELAVTGRDLTRQLPLRGVQLGVFLERLLSYAQKEPAEHSGERLVNVVRHWLG
ncbi:MAG: hypothetical protein PHQ83_01945 [Eubacteriales bacterium]|nr:hypothetical protein [Eubacteriales bacterium]